MPVNFSNVFYTYNPKTPLESAALNGVDLQIEDGSFTAIVGRTGSGKSTMVQMINALLSPSAGEVTVNEFVNSSDKKKCTKKLYKVRRQVGLVFQFPEYQLFAETVEKDVAFAPKNFGLKDAEALEEAHKALRQVGLDESFDKRSPFELSGGEKRRVAIAGILAFHPSILVVDEPTAGLDPRGAMEMMELFEEVHKAGATIILVTHDMNIVLRYAQKVFVVEEGKIVRATDPRSLFFEDIEKYSLERPPLYSFVDNISKRGFQLDASKIQDVETLAAEIVAKRGKKK